MTAKYYLFDFGDTDEGIPDTMYFKLEDLFVGTVEECKLEFYTRVRNYFSPEAFDGEWERFYCPEKVDDIDIRDDNRYNIIIGKDFAAVEFVLDGKFKQYKNLLYGTSGGLRVSFGAILLPFNEK